MWQRLKNLTGGLFATKPVSTGERGEALAAAFLKKRGFKLIARNWRSPGDRRDEIDLIFNDGEVLVFVEVKTRAAAALVSGYHAVNARKKTVVRRAATAYLRALRPPPLTYRFDVVEISIAVDGEPEVRHYENIELFPKHFRP